MYQAAEARDGELRVIVVLGVGRAHPAPGGESIYVAAERLLRRREGEAMTFTVSEARTTIGS